MIDNSNMEGSGRRPANVLRTVLLTLLFLVLFCGVFLFTKKQLIFNIQTYFASAYNFYKKPTGQLESFGGRTNILFMGRAGGVHDGPDLTDTMMLVSVSLKNPDIKIISVPRDIWIPEIGYKINSTYSLGIEKKVDAINFTENMVSKVVGVPIQYGILMNFSGFKDIIDAVGGINVQIDNSFTDYFYPIDGREDDTCGGHDPQFMCRYETLTFNAGQMTMNGETALKFVRSRHAPGIEGSDFAREARQQKVIAALKSKLLDKNTYYDYKKDIKIFKAIISSIQTDMDYPTAAILARIVLESRDSISTFLIPEGILIDAPKLWIYHGQAVLIPSLGDGKWGDINKWVFTTLSLSPTVPPKN